LTTDLFLKLYGQVNPAIDKASVQRLLVYRFKPRCDDFLLRAAVLTHP
jgi:hypothetical protein